MVFLRLILGFIVSKEGKIPNPKKVQVIVNMLVIYKLVVDSSLEWYGLVL
jgi:hypothetical protein